jgi:hypothetical protein
MPVVTLFWGADPANSITGTGVLASQSALVAASGGLGVFGSGELQAQAAALGAAGVVEIVGAGVLEAQSSAITGSGFLSVTGTGVLEAQAATVVGVDAQTIPAVVYDGLQSHLLHTGGPAGAADGAGLTVVWAGTFNSDGSAMVLADIPGTVPALLIRNADNTIDFIGGTSGAVFSNSTAAVAASLGFLIVLASANGTASHLYVIHAAGLITGTNTPGSATNLDLTADWFFGADGGAVDFLDADTAMWWADDSFIDFSDSDNREQFWDTTNDLLRVPGADGSNPTDGALSPLVCHKNHAASHTVNSGTGGDADTAGSFEDGTSPGAYAADFVPEAGSITGTGVLATQAAAVDGAGAVEITGTGVLEAQAATVSGGARDAQNVLSEAVAGYEMKDASNTVVADEFTVFADLTGNGNQLDTTITSLPGVAIPRQEGGGLVWAECDAPNTNLGNAAITNALRDCFAAGGTAYCIVRPDSDGESDLGRVWGGMVGEQQVRVRSQVSTNLQFSYAQIWTTTNLSVRHSTAVPVNTVHALAVTRDDSNGTDISDLTLRLNGDPETPATGLTVDASPAGSTTAATNTLRVGSNAGTNFTFDGGLYLIYFWDTILSEDDLALLDAYAESEYGVTLV